MSHPRAAAPPKPKPPARTRTIACPNCGGTVEIRANGISISAVCASCLSTIDVASPELKVIAEAQARTRQPDLPIGKRGALSGTEWDVIGFQIRSYPATGYTWDEYLLFNPYLGFRFLVHDTEGWTLLRMLHDDVLPPSGEQPEIGQARTDYVLGEFYWRARAGDLAEVTEFPAGTDTLVRERTGDEIVWSRGAMLPRGSVETAFGLPKPASAVPRPSERATTVRVLKFASAAFVLLLLLDLIPFGRSRNQTVYEQTFIMTAADKGRWLSTRTFDVPDQGGNLRLVVESPLQNKWLELQLSLSHEFGGPTFNALAALAYYSGYDSDGTWSEGDQTAEVTFAAVPGGAYRLLVQPDTDALDRPPSTGVNLNAVIAQAAGGQPGRSPAAAAPPPEPTLSFTVRAIRHAPAAEFFWLALLLLLPYPVYRLLFRRGSA